MNIKKRKATAKVIRVRESPSDASDSDSDSANVVRPGDDSSRPAFSKKRKREDGKRGAFDAQAELDAFTKNDRSAKENATHDPEAPEMEEPKVGPVKQQSAIRMTTFTDFAPDVCKDYKKTGFCGFADSCKFLHAREDYKQGWALDEQWEKSGKEGTRPSGTVISSAADRKQGLGNDAERALDEVEEERKLLEKIPFNCTICESSYKNPIVTRCGHYFCEECALRRFRKNPNCAVCGAGTGGVFNGAKKLNELLRKKKAREAAKAAAGDA